jgi:hypothetical protein
MSEYYSFTDTITTEEIENASEEAKAEMMIICQY